MLLVALTIVYLVLHFVLYIAVVRNIPAFGRERNIFLYHAVPAVILTLVVACLVLLTRDSTALAAGVLSLSIQGIYSLSFLELWALCDGGYSLQILEHVASTHATFDASGMHEIGAGKRSDRLKAALDLGLVETDGTTFGLTRSGAPIARAFAAVQWVVDAHVE